MLNRPRRFSEQNREVAFVSEIISVPLEDDQQSETIEQVDSITDDQEVLEAEVETACAKRNEREAFNKFAKVRHAHSSNESGRFVCLLPFARCHILSVFASQVGAIATTSEPALPATLAPPSPLAPPPPRNHRPKWFRKPQRPMSTSPVSGPLNLACWSVLLRMPRIEAVGVPNWDSDVC